ncbi:C25 family cysteine peptidase [Anaerolineales bacterium HSG25]|nr:C25 family cysteine peptidase [Anaerolineales bacterium HSG25]
MRINHLFVLPISVALLIYFVTASMAQQPIQAPLEIISTSPNNITLEFTLPAYQTKLVTHEGQLYQQVTIPDWPEYWGETGQPKLPKYSDMLGLPTLSRPEIELVDYDIERLSVAPIYPVPAFAMNQDGQPEERFSLDEQVYQKAEFMPATPVSVEQPGLMRDQPVATLNIRPFLYNPVTQQLQIYTRLTIRLIYPDGRAHPSEQTSQSPAFEKLLTQSLLNYEQLGRVVVSPARPARTKPQPRQQSSQLKLLVEETGFYRLGYANLQQAMPTLLAVDPNRLEIATQGQPISIWFEGDDDAVFEADESLLFYGKAIDSIYTKHNLYWLRASNQLGLRMSEGDATPDPATQGAGQFAHTEKFEENLTYWQAMPDGEGQDHWFWQHVETDNNPVSFNFTINHLALTNSTGQIKLMMRGGGPYPRHDYSLQASLNGTPLFTTPITWTDREQQLFTIPVSQTLFSEGVNQLQVENITPNRELYVDWFEVTYDDQYVAENNYLQFVTPQPWTNSFTVTNFSTSTLYLFDISKPDQPIRLSNQSMQTQANGYDLKFSFTHPDSSISEQRFIVQSDTDFLTPQLQVDEPSNWQSYTAGATYLIVTAPSFYHETQTLATYRQDQGETVVMVKSDDIYDEFNYGLHSPQAIKDFLIHAYANWTIKPTYLLLVGDSSLDPKNYLGNSRSDLLPAYYVDSPLYGEAPSDRWYSTINGTDEYPDIFVGRLPAMYEHDLTAIVNKIKQYEQNPPPGDWIRRALLLAHDEDSQFAADMDQVDTLLPDSISPIKLYQRNAGNPADIHEQVADIINDGVLLVAYSGHGNEYVWAKGYSIFQESQVWGLKNGNKTPFVTSANCLTGQFSNYKPGSRSLAETLIFKANAGAIAVWSPAGYGFPTPNNIIQNEFYKALIVNNQFQPGVAATTAQLKAYNSNQQLLDFFETFNYLGDPALTLEVPPSLDLSVSAPTTAVTMGQPLNYTLDYSVLGISPARDLTLVHTLPSGIIYQSAMPPPTSIYGQELTWRLGDVSTSQQQVFVTTQLNSSGLTHQQTLTSSSRLYDNYGGETVETVIIVQEQSVTGLTASQNGPILAGETVNFSGAVSGGSNVNFSWHFGDGTVTTASAQRVFTQAGQYPVQLTAYNQVSQQAKQLTVEVLSTPIASFTLPSLITIGQPFTPTNLSQHGHDPANVTYLWQIDQNQNSNEFEPTLIYSKTGVYPLGLIVKNRLIQSVMLTRNVTVVELPIAGLQIQHPLTTTLGAVTPFTATVTQGSNISYTVTISGLSSAVICCQANWQVIFTQTGIYSVQVIASSSNSQTTTTLITVLEQLPQAKFSHSGPDFLGSVTEFLPQSSGTNLTYQWNFGDNSPPIITDTASLISHTYQIEGSYMAVLTASNPRGHDVISHVVEIVRDVGPPMAYFSATSTIQLGESLSPLNLSQDGGDRSEHISYTWAWGTGLSSTGRVVSHTYQQVGSYTVWLTMTNSLTGSQGMDVYSQTVLVEDVPIEGLSLSQTGLAIYQQPITLTVSVLTGSNVSLTWSLDQHNQNRAMPLTDTRTQTFTVGSHTVWVTATNGSSQQTISHTVTIADVPISGLALQNSSPTQVSRASWLTATVEAGSHVGYLWDFGDGETSVTAEPWISHVYPAGVYTAQVTAQNSHNVQTAISLMTVRGCQPIQQLQLQHAKPVYVTEPTAFSATVSQGDEISYQWWFEDGAQARTEQATMQHTYAKVGGSWAVLTATNCWGSIITQSWVTAEDVPIIEVTMSYDHAPSLNMPTVFSVTSQTGSNIVYQWDFGDGTIKIGAVVTHTFKTAGEYEVIMTASNSANQTSQTKQITVMANKRFYIPLLIKSHD